MTDHVEDTPAPTCHLRGDRCQFTYGTARCELPAGHEAPHYIALRFDVAKPSCPSPGHCLSCATPERPSTPRSCANCTHMTDQGCEVWPGVQHVRAADCRTYEARR